MVARYSIRPVIECCIAKPSQSDLASLLQYKYKLDPCKPKPDGEDRVFTFSYYTTELARNMPKNSKERKEIARILRARHSYIWTLFHQVMTLEDW